MENKKKLKRLVLKKEEIVNLNEYQMKSIQGGSTWGCSVSIVQTISVIYSIIKDAYGYDVDHSNLNCPNSKQENCMTDVSKKLVNLGDGTRACEISEVNIYGYYL